MTFEWSLGVKELLVLVANSFHEKTSSEAFFTICSERLINHLKNTWASFFFLGNFLLDSFCE